jgi:hypothetical protein
MNIRPPCQCGEHRQKAIARNGVCACCAARQNARRIAKCPICSRENLPFDEHHPFGQCAQTILRFEDYTVAICKNCHRVVTAFLDPLMKAQRQFLSSQNTEENRAAAFVLGLLTVAAHMAKFELKDDHLAKDLRDGMQRIVRHGTH